MYYTTHKKNLKTPKTWTPAGCSVSWRHTTTYWTKRYPRCETAGSGASNNSSFTVRISQKKSIAAAKLAIIKKLYTRMRFGAAAACFHGNGRDCIVSFTFGHHSQLSAYCTQVSAPK